MAADSGYRGNEVLRLNKVLCRHRVGGGPCPRASVGCVPFLLSSVPAREALDVTASTAMRRTMPFVLLILVAISWRPVRPCSNSSDSQPLQTPFTSAPFGDIEITPSPVFFTPPGTIISIVRNGPSGFEPIDVTLVETSVHPPPPFVPELLGMTPDPPLQEGEYKGSATDPRSVFVVAGAADSPSPVGSTQTLDVAHLSTSGSSCCGGDDGCPWLPYSFIRVTLSGLTAEDTSYFGNYVIRVWNPESDRSEVRFGGDMPWHASGGEVDLRVHFDRRQSQLDLIDSSVCVSLLPVSWSGAFGAPIDVGCAESHET